MAIDTRDKRTSAIHVRLPWRGLYPQADGTIGQPDRQFCAGDYMGITPGGGPTETILDYERAISRGMGRGVMVGG